MSRNMRKSGSWVLHKDRSYTNQTVQSQEQARALQFGVIVEEELYYLCSETKVLYLFKFCRSPQSLD